MTIKQRILKTFYPALMKVSKNAGPNHQVFYNEQQAQPAVPFYSLEAAAISGKTIKMQEFAGKKILIANTASNCGYTAQYEELEKLYQQYKDQLVILAFPANDFNEQEKGSNEEIEAFCKVNYGVTFPVMQKVVVIKKPDQHPVFRWLTSADKNGWNDHQPDWNFSKYIINENGVLTHFFGPAISPLDKQISEVL